MKPGGKGVCPLDAERAGKGPLPPLQQPPQNHLFAAKDAEQNETRPFVCPVIQDSCIEKGQF